MAQRTIHLQIGTYIADRMDLTDRNRFLLGNILPDAYVDRKDREVTHFKRQPGGTGPIHFDFKDFRERFSRQIMEDDLYLGYYLHLFEDVVYRRYLHKVCNFWLQIKTMDDVERLHRDYHLLNTYLVKTYGLQNTVTLPEGLDKEPLLQLCPFRVEGFLQELEGDFHETVEGQTSLLTEALLDGFLDQYQDQVLAEARKIRAGDWSTDPLDYAWIPATANPLVS